MKKNSITKLIAALFCLGGIASCAPAKPTQDLAALRARYDQALVLYNKLEIGMSYDQAIKLLGTPAENPSADSAGPSEVPPVPLPPGFFWEFHGETSDTDGSIYPAFAR